MTKNKNKRMAIMLDEFSKVDDTKSRAAYRRSRARHEWASIYHRNKCGDGPKGPAIC